MKKIFVFLLALIMVLSLAACGGGDDEKTPSSDDKTPSSTGQQEQNIPDPDPAPDDKTGNNELYEVADNQITAVDGLDVSVIPEVARKGIGTLKDGGFDLSLPTSTFSDMYDAQCEVTYFDVSEDGFNSLLAYYEENGGEVSEEFGSIEAVFDWGKIVPIYHADQKQISLTVYIGAGEAAGEPWPENDLTALVPTPAQGKVILTGGNDTFATIEVAWTYDEALAYVEQLKEAGFGDDIVETFEQQKTINRSNNGVNIELVYWEDGQTLITIIKE